MQPDPDPLDGTDSRMAGGVGPKLWTTNAYSVPKPRRSCLWEARLYLLASFVTGLLLGAAVARL